MNSINVWFTMICELRSILIIASYRNVDTAKLLTISANDVLSMKCHRKTLYNHGRSDD